MMAKPSHEKSQKSPQLDPQGAPSFFIVSWEQRESAPEQARATSKRMGLIGRCPRKLIPRNRLQDSQFRGIKLLRMILRERRGSHSECSPQGSRGKT